MDGLPISFLTWNLAMLERSRAAPPDWTEEHTQAEVRRIVLELSPDLVLLQELPGVVPYVETHDMIRANPMSHSGNLATLVGHDLMEEEPTFEVVPGVAVLVTFPTRNVTIANVHLAPGRSGAATRIEQLRLVLDAAPTADLAVVGDTNTRTDEEQAIAEIGLNGPRPPRPTWDGRRNRFRGPSGDFVAYFTRCFVRGGLVIQDEAVLSEPVAIDGLAGFHLSDHFALTGIIASAD
ncbi:MAG: endonuclease/exonuclease/phosphatase family protein [Acidimicrobiales bacterium]